MPKTNASIYIYMYRSVAILWLKAGAYGLGHRRSMLGSTPTSRMQDPPPGRGPVGEGDSGPAPGEVYPGIYIYINKLKGACLAKC